MSASIDEPPFTIYTENIRFDWDPKKNAINISKHGISFEQAITAFDDPFGRVEDDPKHSTEKEKRELWIGKSDVGVLMVIFTVRSPGSIHRLISARRANKRERRRYEENKRIQF